jgi:hypothetical protein
MTSLRARPYRPQDEQAWDELVARSWNGTFLHSRRYLSYAADRFTDTSLVVEDSRSALLGVLPAAVHASDPTMIESHPAVGYGGIVHAGDLRGPAMKAALEAVAERYYHDGRQSLRYKVVPPIYHRVPAQDDLYALFRLDASRSRCDVASVIDLANRPAPASRRLRSLRKAERAGVEAARGPDQLEPVWSVVSGRLAEKYQTEPLHDLAALTRLQSLFPGQIGCVAGTLDGRVVAGVVIFHIGQVDHAQYIGADDRGYETSALDLVIRECLADGERRGIRSFSFGNSTLYGGRVFSESLFAFKSEFGAGVVVHECYDLSLV